MHGPHDEPVEHPATAGPADTGRFVACGGWDYSVPELLGIAREHGVPVAVPITHQGLAAALTDRGVPRPRKT